MRFTKTLYNTDQKNGGGGLVQQIRKSYSLSDLSECEVREERGADEADDVLAEPRVIRRVAKSSGYNTRRSASESNSRTTMYFPEVDVDVRGPRTARADEPDFSHIKSTEDISSGYSSADNSLPLARAGSAGAAARARRPARSAVTAIKRPQAAEDNEVFVEELPGDDTFEYANMPPLVNLHHLFLSHTDPPFLYQYVGDQVRIVKVLGNDSLGTNLNQFNIDKRDQNENIIDDNSEMKLLDTESQDIFENAEDIEIKEEERTIESEGLVLTAKKNESNAEITEIPISDNVLMNTGNLMVTLKMDDEVRTEKEPDNVLHASENEAKSLEHETNVPVPTYKTNESVTNDVKDDPIASKEEMCNDKADSTSLDTSAYENDSADSDDEASFGTPDNSPRSKRKSKSPKGKYGKSRAPPPPPPKADNEEVKSEQQITTEQTSENVKTSDGSYATIGTTANESLKDILINLPNTPLKETTSLQTLQVVNPIAEKKKRHKSKSPGRIPKGNGSGISKLLQLPSKLAFWHKSDDKLKTDTTSMSSRSRSQSRRSSGNEQQSDVFQSYNTPFDTPKEDAQSIADDQVSFVDAADFESEAISHDIMEKSDALQKLIEAKIESHPEYKFVSLHDDIPTTSKSTDV